MCQRRPLLFRQNDNVYFMQATFELSDTVDITQQTLPQTHQRSNQLKLQENKPKFLTVEVISSKTKASVTIDGTTVSTFFNL